MIFYFLAAAIIFQIANFTPHPICSWLFGMLAVVLPAIHERYYRRPR
jgi:hypothetical protein